MGQRNLNLLLGTIDKISQATQLYKDKQEKAARELYEKEQRQNDLDYRDNQAKLEQEEREANRKFREEQSLYNREQDKAKQNKELYDYNRKRHDELIDKSEKWDREDELEQKKTDLEREAMRYRMMSKLPASQRMQMEAQDQLEGQNILSNAFDPSESDALMEAAQNQKQIEDEAAWASAMKKKMDIKKAQEESEGKVNVYGQTPEGTKYQKSMTKSEFEEYQNQDKQQKRIQDIEDRHASFVSKFTGVKRDKVIKALDEYEQNPDSEIAKQILQLSGYFNQQTK